MKIEDIKPCPFCGGLAENHPNDEEGKFLFVVRHLSGCYLGKQVPKGIFYLISADDLKEWNDRKWGEKIHHRRIRKINCYF